MHARIGWGIGLTSNDGLLEWMQGCLQRGTTLLVCTLPFAFAILGVFLPHEVWAQAAPSPLPVTTAAWSVAYGGQDASLTAVTDGGQAAPDWQVTSAPGHSDWVFDTLLLATDQLWPTPAGAASARGGFPTRNAMKGAAGGLHKRVGVPGGRTLPGGVGSAED